MLAVHPKDVMPGDLSASTGGCSRSHGVIRKESMSHRLHPEQIANSSDSKTLDLDSWFQKDLSQEHYLWLIPPGENH